MTTKYLVTSYEEPDPYEVARVELKRCKDLSCIKGNHLQCLYCHELLHATPPIYDSLDYEVIISICRDVTCFGSVHKKCPQCYRSVHVNIQPIIGK